MSVCSFRSTLTSTTTPSSILKKTSSLKTRLSQVATKSPIKVRFALPDSKKVKSILQDYVEKGSVREYEQLLVLIRDAELQDEDISSLLKESTECISIMDKNLRLFVEALLRVNWIDRSKPVIKKYQSFIVNLISAHNYHADFVISYLTTLFIPPQSNPEVGGYSEVDPNAMTAELKKCSHVHSLLKILTNVIPMCINLLVQSLISKFPFYKKSSHIHEFYLHNLLAVIEYLPTVRPAILHLIFSKMVILDVHAPREKIEKLHSNDGMDDDFDDIDDIFMMDFSRKEKQDDIKSIMETLDVCLEKIFNYIISECHDSESEELDWNKTKGLYQHMLTVFEEVIVPTYNIHHVQFVMFLMCTFKPTITEAFLNYLWKKVCNVNGASTVRQAAINYMVSFMARGNFVPIELIKGTLQHIAQWIHIYIGAQDGLECVNSDVRVHVVFYTVCQALFYIIAFRHKDLIKSKKSIVFLDSLNLSKIVTCRLNPLRVCQPAVVQNFAALTRKYQLAYCYSVMEHNSRNTLQTMYKDEKGSSVMSINVLDGFYPFDPYMLQISGEKIHPYYKEYKEVKLKRKPSDQSSSKEGGDIDDDFLDRDLPSNSKVSKFSYGSSPGFKTKS